MRLPWAPSEGLPDCSRSKVLRGQGTPDKVRYGPFVMNTADEIQRAFEDFRAGRFGEIKPLVAE